MDALAKIGTACRLPLVLIAIGVMTGCATTGLLDTARQQFSQGQPDAALASLEQGDSKSRRNILLLHMEKGLILHNLGKYEESALEFRNAVDVMDAQDYVSISRQAKTLLVNDWVGSYKGEYSERLWVHSYQMMNYLLLNKPQSAAVEARQALKVLDKYQEPLKEDWFTRALVGLSFESVGKSNDALIEYRKLAKDMPDSSAIAPQLYAATRKLGQSGESEQFRLKIPAGLKNISGASHGELILFIADGSIPRKISGDIFAPPDIRISFPVYPQRYHSSPVFSVKSLSVKLPFSRVSTHLGQVASSSLDARGKSIAAKEIARVGIKQSIVHDLKKNDEVAGELLGLLFMALEEADTRGWGTLPAGLSMLRVPLKPGIHDVVVTAGRGEQGVARDVIKIENMNIKAGQKIYYKARF